MQSFDQKDQNCWNCNACRDIPGAPPGCEQRWCCAHPATPIIVGAVQPSKLVGAVQQQPQIILNYYYPCVRQKDWCREWQPAVEGSA